jgi:uncharacterized RDD family membrane protein YckC
MFCPECGAAAATAHKYCTQCGTALAAGAQAVAGPPPLPGMTSVPSAQAPVSGEALGPVQPLEGAAEIFAPFWPRVAAFAIDFVLVVLICGAVNGVLGITLGTRNATQTFFWLTVVALLLYKSAMESSTRQGTLGKLAFDMKVTTLKGQRISFARALSRNFSQLFSALIAYIGYLMPAFTLRRQALHDMIAGTLVTSRHWSVKQIAVAAEGETQIEGVPAKAAPAPAPRAPKARLRETRPELPLRVSFRDCLLGEGKRAVLQNLSDDPLVVVLDVQSPLTGAHFRRTFVINARCYGQVGQSQGWPFAPGQRVTVTNPQYRPIIKTVN